MEKSNVVDFFTKQSYTAITAQDFHRNNTMTEEMGVYLGCLVQSHASRLRSLIADLEFKRVQLDQLTEEWERLNDEKELLLQHCFNYLNNPGTKNINLEDDEMMIAENGHIWVIYNYDKNI